MAGSVNKVILIGNLGKDPEIRRTQDGRPIANLSVATSDTWRDKATGERKEKTEWHRVVIFSEGLCRVAEQYLKKGSKVYLEGSLQTAPAAVAAISTSAATSARRGRCPASASRRWPGPAGAATWTTKSRFEGRAIDQVARSAAEFRNRRQRNER